MLESSRRDGVGDGAPRPLKLAEAPLARVTEWLRRDRRGKLLWRDDAVPCLAPPAGARSVRQLEPYGPSIVGTARPADVERSLRQDPDAAARFLYAWPQGQDFHPLPGLELPSEALLAPLGRLLRASDAPRRRMACCSTVPPRGRSRPSACACMRRGGTPQGRRTGSRRRGWARAAARSPAWPVSSR